MSKTRRELWVFLFTIFLLHLITKFPVIPVTVMFRQHPASHLLKCCPLQAQQLIYVTMFLFQTQHQRQQLLTTERKGEAVQMTKFDPYTSSFADEFK